MRWRDSVAYRARAFVIMKKKRKKKNKKALARTSLVEIP